MIQKYFECGTPAQIAILFDRIMPETRQINDIFSSIDISTGFGAISDVSFADFDTIRGVIFPGFALVDFEGIFVDFDTIFLVADSLSLFRLEPFHSAILLVMSILSIFLFIKLIKRCRVNSVSTNIGGS